MTEKRPFRHGTRKRKKVRNDTGTGRQGGGGGGGRDQLKTERGRRGESTHEGTDWVCLCGAVVADGSEVQ